MARICIVAVTFDRPHSFERLFASLRRADYAGDEVDLLVSIDGGPRSERMIEMIGDLDWPHGQLQVRRMSENLGLRRHILKCGETAREYDAIILLEDDIAVSAQFYNFTRWAIQEYGENRRVAGISLYAPAYNEMANLPFIPEPSDKDVYALQSAQSWGQCWTRSMWEGFARWYRETGEKLERAPDMPDRIYSWPDSSWKKFAMKYLVETDKTWIYPYQSHSTNCSDIGTHNKQETALFQVPLANECGPLRGGELAELRQYDIYFERVGAPLPEPYSANHHGPTICDLYGTRQQAEGPAYLLTTRILQKKPSGSFGFSFKPHETNAAQDNPGDAARLYWLDDGEQLDLSAFPRARQAEFYAALNWPDQVKAGLAGMRNALWRRIGRWL